jgi:hypothetical protein
VLDGVQHLVQPGSGLLGRRGTIVQAELHQPAVGDVADVFLDLARGQSLDRPLLEGEIDERVLVFDDGGAGQVDFALQFLGPDSGFSCTKVRNRRMIESQCSVSSRTDQVK